MIKIRRHREIARIKNCMDKFKENNLDLLNLSYSQTKDFLEKNCDLHNIAPDRFTAMVLSYARGNTTDQDGVWYY